MDSPSSTPSSQSETTDPDDSACATRAQAGDMSALDELVSRHHAAITRLLWRFARSRADLDDLVQETFLRMVRGLPAWRPHLPFSHWLLRIATNTGRDYFRRRRVRDRWQVPAGSSSGETDAPPPEAVDPGADPAARAAAEEVKQLLDHLSPDERALLTLHHLEGWGLADIARNYGWTLTATKLRAWRARRRLRALYESATPS
ncbi:MAG: RNA polymerase sigma factor [Opitutaceae bacterium]